MTTCGKCGAQIQVGEAGWWEDSAPVNPRFCPHAIDFAHTPIQDAPADD